MKNIINQIKKINNSEDLNVVIEAIKAQRKIINNAKVAKAKNNFKNGDTVLVTSKKLIETGTIVKMKIKRAIVEIDGKRWDCPLSILSEVA